MLALRSAALLAHLQADALHSLAERTEESVFEVGETLCTEGEFGDSVYILIEGQTEILRSREGRETPVGCRKQGECVGEMAVLDPGPRTATVRALDGPVRVLTVPGDEFRGLIGRDPTATLNVIRLMIDRRGYPAQAS
jgi:CRP-like cAMP-binding protein